MPTVVGSHSIASFVNPLNGQPLNADIVRGNDNSLRISYVAHDADPGVHLQSSTVAGRPAAGTAGRKWMTTDGGVKLWYDTGSVWEEIAYVPTTGNVTLANDLTVTGTTTLNGNAALNGGTIAIGNATSDTVTVTARVGSDLVPDTTNTHDLGTSALRFKALFLEGNATITGTVTSGTGFAGSGASLTGVPAGSITSGTFGSGNYTFPGDITTATGTISGGSMLATAGQMRAARATGTTAGATTTLSFTSVNHHRLTLAHNSTVSLSNGVAGGVYTVEILQDGSGGRTLAWGANVVWSGGVAPVATTTANRKDVYTFFYDGSNYLGVQFGANFASTG